MPNPVWLAAGLAGVFLTAYYAFRLIFILWLPRAAQSSGTFGPPPEAAGLSPVGGPAAPAGVSLGSGHGEAGHESNYWPMALAR